MEEKEQETTIEEIEKIRKENLIKFLKKKQDWIFYGILAIIVWLGAYIRTRNIPKLKDVTTGGWTLGPDLDPFLFLRWAEYIVENGKLFEVDLMRNVPLGFETAREGLFLPYLIAWFHKFLAIFSLTDSITYSAIIFPVFMFALTAIAFFLFARKIFYKESYITRSLIALIATALFVTIPALLPRTIAGIPEKESAAFFFMFLAFYFFLEAFTAKKFKNGLIFGVLSGIATGLMALIWGGVLFIFFTIPSAVLFSFAIGKINKKRVFVYCFWLISALLVMMPFSLRYTPRNLINSLPTGFAIGTLVIILIGIFLLKNKKIEKIKDKVKLPKELISLILAILILVLVVSIFFGPDFIFNRIESVYNKLVEPSESRFSFTVAENKQPYFNNDWKDSFGPYFFGIPLFFWMFFIGSIYLFSFLVKNLRKKEKITLVFSYFVFLSAIIFSRYSPSSKFNGTNGLSIFLYFGGWILFLVMFFYIYRKKYLGGEFSEFKGFNFSYILYFIILTIGIIGARGAVRLIMVLASVTPIVVAFLAIKIGQNYFKEKEELKRFFSGLVSIIAIVIIVLILIGNPLMIFKGTGFWGWQGNFQQSKFIADNFAPGVYQWQWQNAMSWVRENTPEDSVFAHWWDYGYWVQTLGERATVLDGGNAIVYWNHLIGRHVLTGSDENKALEFLYTHNVTHLLIDSTEIGKYTAFSSIGADENYDRFSWIPTFRMDESQTTQLNNETSYVYFGGSNLDDDILWIDENGDEVFLLKNRAVYAAIILKEIDKQKFSQPLMVFIDNSQQYTIPLRYMYFETTGDFIDFESGLEAGIFIFPRVNSINNEQVNLNYFGSALYLSPRTVNSQLVQKYLFNKESEYIRFVHTEENPFVENLKKTGVELGSFVDYQGLQGPIKIWEISYPKDTEANPDFLEITYPNESLNLAKPGEY